MEACVNTLIDELLGRMAREVGTQGVLGGQVVVPGVEPAARAGK